MTEARDRAPRSDVEAVGLAAEDADAFDAVIAAYRLPKETEAETATRAARIQEALAAAADVPRRTAAAAAEIVELAERIVHGANPNVVSRRSRGRRRRPRRAARLAREHRREPRLDHRPSLRAELDEAALRSSVTSRAPTRWSPRSRARMARMTLLDGRPLAAGIRAAAGGESAAQPSPRCSPPWSRPTTPRPRGMRARSRRPPRATGIELRQRASGTTAACARRARGALGRPRRPRDHLPDAAARRAHARRGGRAESLPARTSTARARRASAGSPPASPRSPPRRRRR